MGAMFALKKIDVASVGIEKEKEEVTEMRRRNSLVFNIKQYLEAAEGTTLSYEAVVNELRIKIESKKPQVQKEMWRKTLTNKLTDIGEAIYRGNARELKHQVNRNFKKINRVYHNLNGNAILHMACQEGYVEMVEKILDPHAHASFDEVAIDHTIKNDRHRVALLLCFTPPTATYNGLLFGITPSGEAVAPKPEGVVAPGDWIQPGGRRQREACVKLLVENGADPNTRDFHEFTPLHMACIWGWEAAAKALIAKGADVNAICAQGKSPLLLAAEFLRSGVVDILVSHRSLNVNLTDREGHSALVTVAEKGPAAMVLDIARRLLQSGADPNLETHDRCSALLYACKNNDLPLVTLLLDCGVFRNESILSLLTGAAAVAVGPRVALERDDDSKAAEKAQSDRRAHAREGAIDVVTEGYRLRPAFGAWVEYKDKRSNDLFYYNPVTRQCQRDVPNDFANVGAKDKISSGGRGSKRPKGQHMLSASKGVKEAVFGLHFYH